MWRRKESVWIPIEVDEVEDTDNFLERLIRWQKDPTSEPDLERWYKYGEPKGLPFQVLKLTQAEIDAEEYQPMYIEAQELEKREEQLPALEIYRRILSLYNPIGTVYYENPIWILERMGEYEEAIEICNRAIEAIKNKGFNANIEDFQKIKIRLIDASNK